MIKVIWQEMHGLGGISTIADRLNKLNKHFFFLYKYKFFWSNLVLVISR